MTSPLQKLTSPAGGIELWCKRDDLHTSAPGTALQGNKVRKLEPILKAALSAPVKPVRVWPVPEGGSGPGAAESVGKLYTEIVGQLGAKPDYICLSAGTGCSAAGVIAAAAPETRVEVYPALKGDWMAQEIIGFLPDIEGKNWACIPDYHFGGYARFPKEWTAQPRLSTSPGTSALAQIADIGEPGLPPLDPVYNAKLFYGVLDRIRKGCYPTGSSLVIVHSGGVY